VVNRISEENEELDDDLDEEEFEDPNEAIVNISKNLQKLGTFTVNDSRIYTTLLMIGLSSPAKISEKSQVDRARVYDSLKRLVKRGIVEEEPVPRAPRYRAIAPEKVFSQIRYKLRKRIKLTEELERRLQRIKIAQTDQNNSVWSIQGEGKIKKLFKQFLDEAKQSCLIILTNDESPQSLRELEQITEDLLEKKRKFPTFSIKVVLKVFPASKEQKALINQMYHSEIEIFRWIASPILPFGLY